MKKKQLEAQLKRMKAKLENLQSKSFSKGVSVEVDIVNTAKDWISKTLKAQVIKEEKNTYKVSNGELKSGTLLHLDNGKKFQVGTARFWVLK